MTSLFNKLTIIHLLFVVMLLLISCSDGKEDSSASNDIKTYAVEVLYSINGLGDLGYQDNIYTGFRRSQQELGGFVLETYLPKTLDEAEALIQQWIDEGKRPDIASVMSKRLLVLADGTYSSLFDKHPDWGNTPNNDILLLDQDAGKYNVYSCNLPLYGACYLAGEVVHDSGAEKVACVVANKLFDIINIAADGFVKGYRDSGGTFDETKDFYTLGNTMQDGFTASDSLYRLSFDFAEQGYRYVFAVAGGSSQGLFRYTRQHGKEASCFYTNGMDVDQQQYSDRVTFSVIKRMDKVCMDFMRNWVAGNHIDQHVFLGLESGYVDVLPAKAYESLVGNFEEQRKKAIEEERRYYSQ